jgi:hypothetical protein
MVVKGRGSERVHVGSLFGGYALFCSLHHRGRRDGSDEKMDVHFIGEMEGGW